MNLNSLMRKIGVGKGRFKASDRVAPPVLGSATRFPYGPFQFKTRLPKDTVYVIQASTDLKNWKMVSEGSAASETVDYIDSEASEFSHRFYRLSVGETPSLNILGYVSITLPPGFSMIANPLDSPNNMVSELFKGWPDGTSFSKFDVSLFRLAENQIKAGKWSNPAEKLGPGEGAIFFNPTFDYKAINFAGQVMQGNLSVPIPAGFSVRSSVLPIPGNLHEDLEFPVGNGDVIHLFDRERQKYILHPFENDNWTNGPPVVSVGESFWVAKTEPGNWRRSFFAGK